MYYLCVRIFFINAFVPDIYCVFIHLSHPQPRRLSQADAPLYVPSAGPSRNLANAVVALPVALGIGSVDVLETQTLITRGLRARRPVHRVLGCFRTKDKYSLCYPSRPTWLIRPPLTIILTLIHIKWLSLLLWAHMIPRPTTPHTTARCVTLLTSFSFG